MLRETRKGICGTDCLLYGSNGKVWEYCNADQVRVTCDADKLRLLRFHSDVNRCWDRPKVYQTDWRSARISQGGRQESASKTVRDCLGADGENRLQTPLC